MMGIPPSEAKRLTWWEYQALLWNWNDRHPQPGEDGDPAEAPDAEFVARRHEMLERRGIARMVH
jgi:hypothetical protein